MSQGQSQSRIVSEVRVFNVNKAIGLASSGVEYAQSYRRQVFADIPWVEDYYVFTDYLPTNVSVFSDRLGFDRGQVLWIYNLLTGRATAPCTLSVEAFAAQIAQPHEVPRSAPQAASQAASQAGGEVVEIGLTDAPVLYRLRTVDGGFVDRVETLVRGELVRVEHYDETLNNVEHLHENSVVRRVFYTPDGRVGAEQFYRGRAGQAIVRTRITPASPLYDRVVRAGTGRPSSFRGDVLLDGRSRFFQHVFAHLFDRPDDVVIIDRALDVIDAVYPVIAGRRLYSVVHAEHYDLTQHGDGVLLWNNHYENVFTRPDLVDGLIVSTHRQKQVLERQLAASAGAPPAIPVTCIPVGVVTRTAAQPQYDRDALVTASRLADEKHLDLLIRAVCAARRSRPGLRLDIFGEGARGHLLDLIRELGAEEYVRLMGHRRLDGLLGSYALYVSASTSEGFGLSVLEAIAEGLPVVGFDVDYGNRELVEQGVNGCLVPYTGAEQDVAEFAAAIVRVLSAERQEELRANSLLRAEAYTAPNVRALWERLLADGEARSC